LPVQYRRPLANSVPESVRQLCTPLPASRAHRGTRNLRAVQVLLEHASIATAERYVAVDDSEIRAAMVAALRAPPCA
jgi:hypothetical protein